MVWKLLPTLSAPMPLQMALDEQLFLSQKIDPQSPVLRFYVSSSPWISVGYSFREEADLAKRIGQGIKAESIDIQTGDAVLHTQLITEILGRTCAFQHVQVCAMHAPQIIVGTISREG